jgi:toxin HigB-1
MPIISIRHGGLRRLVEDDDETGLPRTHIQSIKNIIFYLQNIESESELFKLKRWKPHKLKGDRKGTWSLRVSANWRILFSVGSDRVDDGKTETQVEIFDLDFEDYH